MADKVNFDITATDSSAAAFRSVTQNFSDLERTVKSSSRAFGEILKGGGLLIGFKELFRTLDDVAKKFADTDAGAKMFSDSISRIGDAFDHGVLEAVKFFAPYVESLADHLDPAAIDMQRLADATSEYAAAQKALNDALREQAASASLGLGPGPITGDAGAAAARLERAKQALEVAQAQVKGNQQRRIGSQLDEAIGKNRGGIFGGDEFDLIDAASKAREDQQKRLKGLADKAFEDSIARENDSLKEQDELRKSLADNEAAYTKYNEEEDLRAIKETNKAQEEAAKKMQQESQQFGDFFVRVIEDSGELGFKGLVESFGKALLEMELKAEASKLYQSFGGTAGILGAIGSGISGLIGGPGSNFMQFGAAATGADFTVGGKLGRDTNLLTMAVTRGERVTVTPQGQGRGAVVQNIHVDARNASDPAMVQAAVRIAVAQANAQRRDDQRRGR